MSVQRQILLNNNPGKPNLNSDSKFKSWYFLFGLILLLVGMGLNILLASTTYLGRVSFGDPFHYVKKQAVFIFLGIVVFFIFSHLSYHIWKKLAWPIYFLSLILLLLVFIPGVGHKAGGASRWIHILGLSIQPSDIAKFAVILVLARIADPHEFLQWKQSVVAIFVVALPILLIAVEPDLGTALHLLATSGIFLLFIGISIPVLATSALITLPLLFYSLSMVTYRWNRIKAFLNPWEYRFQEAYQLIASYKSFLAGGLWGQGLGEGFRRHNLQARHTDFILAIVAEDLGFFGIAIVLILYVIISVYALLMLKNVEVKFGRLLGTGIILLFSVQALINVAVTMGVLPTTGINLPLFSYGGTSALTYLGMMGIVVNVLKEDA